MQSKAHQIIINSCPASGIERIKDAIKFIEASRMNDMTNKDILEFLDNFKNRTQANIIKQIIKFEDSLIVYGEYWAVQYLGQDNFKYLTGDKL